MIQTGTRSVGSQRQARRKSSFVFSALSIIGSGGFPPMIADAPQGGPPAARRVAGGDEETSDHDATPPPVAPKSAQPLDVLLKKAWGLLEVLPHSYGDNDEKKQQSRIPFGPYSKIPRAPVFHVDHIYRPPNLPPSPRPEEPRGSRRLSGPASASRRCGNRIRYENGVIIIRPGTVTSCRITWVFSVLHSTRRAFSATRGCSMRQTFGWGGWPRYCWPVVSHCTT